MNPYFENESWMKRKKNDDKVVVPHVSSMIELMNIIDS
jgi:hypothetical protein